MNMELIQLEAAVWKDLEEGGIQIKHPFHNFVLGYNHINDTNLGDESKNIPGLERIHLRTIVLRKASSLKKQILFFTDIRSKKWNEIESSPKISTLFYDPIKKLQISMQGVGILNYKNQLWEDEWNKLKVKSRKTYMTELPPGSFSTQKSTGLKPELQKADLELEETQPYQMNFGIILIQVVSLEIVQLAESGNYRANFDYKKHKLLSTNWLIP